MKQSSYSPLGSMFSSSALTVASQVSPAPVNTTGTAGDDTIHGSDFADRISGGSGGIDRLYGYGGDDVIDGGDESFFFTSTLDLSGEAIYGGAGNDTLHGNGGSDIVMGEEGNDKLYGDADSDRLDGGAGNDLLDGGDGGDILWDAEGHNTLLGGAGSDNLFTMAGTTGTQGGGDGDDILKGWLGVDFIGGAGDDQIELGLSRIGAGNSTIDGGLGDDHILFSFERPGPGGASVRGGGGRDTYTVSGEMAADSRGLVTIQDFASGPSGDRIDLRALLGAEYASNPFGNGFLRLVDNGAASLIDIRVADAPGGYVPLLILAGIAASALTRENFVDGIDPTGLSDGLTLEGTASSDLLTGTPYADTLRGHAGDDRLAGNSGNDTLEGGAGNDAMDGGDGKDSLSGGAGTDTLNGGNGVDRALYTGARSDYTVTRSPTGATVTDKRGAGDGMDTLEDVERLAFADGHLALDTNGVAGDIYRLYSAAFDRAPDLVGQGFWMEMLERGVSLHTVAASFVASEEFAKLYGAAPTNAEIVTRLYQNILDREPEPGGYAFWLDILDTKKADLPTVVLAFSNGEENSANVAELIANGIAYTPFG